MFKDKTINVSFLVIGIVTLLIIAVIWIIVIYLKGSDSLESSNNMDTGINEPIVTPTIIERSLTGLTIDEDRKNVLLAAESLLNETLKLTDESMENQLEKLDNNDSSFITDNFIELIQFNDTFNESEDARITVYQSLIALTHTMNNANEIKVITPTNDLAFKNVFVDQEAGQAFVPIEVFTGQETFFSLEFVYVDNEWKFSPYTFVEAVRMSATLGTNN